MLESRNIYRPSSPLLDYLSLTTDGKLTPLDVPEFSGQKFDAIYNFGRSRAALISAVPVDERITENTDRINFVGFTDPSVLEAMRTVTLINDLNKPEDENARLRYQQALFQAFTAVNQRLQLSNDATVFFPPLNGGALIEAFFQHLGVIIDHERQVADITLKRLQRGNGELMVGVKEARYPEGDFIVGVVLDDCLASDVSASTSIDLMLNRYPNLRRILVVVSAATQKGVESLLQEWNDIDLQVIAAAPVFAMNPHFYLMRTFEEGYPDGTFFVGDMGRWAASLGRDYNAQAPWNQYR